MQARHVICVNYLCEKITALKGPEALSELRKAEGVEQETLFRLHSRIRGLLRGLCAQGRTVDEG